MRLFLSALDCGFDVMQLLQAPANATHSMMDNGLWWKQKLAFSLLSCIMMHSPEFAAVFSGRKEKCISLFFQKESFQWRFWRLLFFIFQLTSSLSFSLWMPVHSWHVFIYFLYLKCLTTWIPQDVVSADFCLLGSFHSVAREWVFSLYTPPTTHTVAALKSILFDTSENSLSRIAIYIF